MLPLHLLEDVQLVQDLHQLLAGVPILLTVDLESQWLGLLADGSLLVDGTRS